MDTEEKKIPTGNITYHLITKTLPHSFEHALNEAIEHGWIPIHDTFIIGSSQLGQMEYAILTYRVEP